MQISATTCVRSYYVLESVAAEALQSMRDEIGPFGRRMAERYFEPVRFPQSAVDTLGRLHEQGFVVHVMRSSAWVNYLYLTWALVKHHLPPVRAVVNLRRWFTKPWTRTAQRGDFDVRFTYARMHGGSGLVFLRETALGVAEGRHTDEDPFPVLVDMARKSDRPVFLVPELFAWEKWKTKVAPSVFDRLFGSPEAPGFLHSVLTFLRNYHRAQFRVGEPIDLNAFVRENADTPTAVLARKVRSALHHHLARETRAVFGPPLKSTDRLIEETLRDRTLRKTIEEVAQEKNRSVDSLQREAKRNLDAIAARQSASVVAMASPVLNWVFNRIYDGIEVDEVGLERAMKAAATAPVVLTPSHKSHVDYLIMSYVLWYRGYQVPLVAAGDNLSFPPLGTFLRRGGAFFLRRSFKGDKVYQASFRAYLKKLVHDGIHHEFFPEGGRSRTGKLLQPKLGLFTWLVDAVLEGARDDLLFVPIAIDYEKVVESAAYGDELKGGEKKKEGVKDLVQAPRVLSENYGRIHLSFDEPISLAALMKERGIDLKSVTEEQKRSLVRALGNRVMYGISRVSTVTPHALLASALLAHRRRGIAAKDVSERIVFLRRVAEDLNARLSKQLVDAPSSPTTLGPVADALQMFAAQGMVKTVEALGEPIYQLEDNKRPELAFYKNTLLNLVAGRVIVACAMVRTKTDQLPLIRERALVLSRLFKFELTYPVGKTFEVIFDETVEHLAKLGVVVRSSEGVLKAAPEPFAQPMLEFLADMIRDYLESYWLTAKAASVMPAAGLDKKELVARTLEGGRGEFLAGSLGTSEALSSPNVANAVQYLVDQKVLTEQDKKLVPGQASAKALMDTIRSYLGET
jgi:glycerol-3-phosphate O-acyltransferase